MKGSKSKRRPKEPSVDLFEKFLHSTVSPDAVDEFAQWWVDDEKAGKEVAELKTKLSCVEQTTTMGVDGAEKKADRIAELQAQIEAMRGGLGAEVIRKRRESKAEAQQPQVADVTPTKVTEVRPTHVGAKMSRKGLVVAYAQAWPTIETDLNDASRNGLNAARTGQRGWVEHLALDWARSKGKLPAEISRGESAANPDPMAAHFGQLASLPRQRHTF